MVEKKYRLNIIRHSSIQVTMDIYGHIMPETAEQSVKVLDNLFKKDKVLESKVVYATG